MSSERKHGLSAEQFPVSRLCWVSKELKDLTDVLRDQRKLLPPHPLCVIPSGGLSQMHPPRRFSPLVPSRPNIGRSHHAGPVLNRNLGHKKENIY